MASTIAPSFSLLNLTQKGRNNTNSTGRNHRCGRIIIASEMSGGKPPFGWRKGPSGVDTRIHWDNPDEGWIGGKTTKSDEDGKNMKEEEILGQKFADLLRNSTDSHYQFMGISEKADIEEIKGAYRRLSKEYHPDTTSLPLKVASEKFLQLREVYDVLSNEERRRFYDWTLAQEATSRQAERMKMKLEDPYQQDVRNWESIPDMVDRLGGRNMELSDQAQTALTIDIVVIIFSLCCLLYVVLFKESY